MSTGAESPTEDGVKGAKEASCGCCFTHLKGGYDGCKSAGWRGKRGGGGQKKRKKNDVMQSWHSTQAAHTFNHSDVQGDRIDAKKKKKGLSHISK